jgi:DNA-binding CsgD family transcriptional regulator
VVSGDLTAAGAPGPPAQPPFAWAVAAIWTGEWEQSRRFWETFKVFNRAAGSKFSERNSLQWLARLYCVEGDYGRAEEVLSEALSDIEEFPSVALEMLAQSQLALVYALTRRANASRPHLDRCAEIMAGGEDWRGTGGRVLLARGAVAAADHQFDIADALFSEALDTFRRYGLPWDEAETLHVCGQMCARAGRRYRARALEALDGALKLYRDHGAGLPVLERVEKDRRSVLSKARGPVYPAGLSEREVEVLRLLAVGRTNRQIAEELVIATDTVARHVSNILNKTGTANRVEAAAYAVRHSLAS